MNLMTLLTFIMMFTACNRANLPSPNNENALTFNQAQHLGNNDMRQVVGILYDKKPICTGTILNSRMVVTAAHCLDGRDVKKFSIYMGKYPEGTNFSSKLDGVSVPETITLSSKFGFFEGDKLAQGDIGLMKFSSNLPVPNNLQMAFAPFFIKPLDFREFQGLITERKIVYGIGYGLSNGNGNWAKTIAPMRVVGVEPHRGMLLLAGNSFAGPGDSGAAIFVKVNESKDLTTDNLRLVGVLSAAIYNDVTIENRVYRGPALVTPITAYLDDLKLSSTLVSTAPESIVNHQEFTSWLSAEPKFDDFACGSEETIKKNYPQITALPRRGPCYLPICKAFPPRTLPTKPTISK